MTTLWPPDFAWSMLDTWIVVVGGLSGMSCALLGTFLVLRKMSMMGDAISHAVLPGLAVAFLITGSRSSLTMLIGAGVVGVLTALFTEWIQRAGKVDPSASMGVVFTILFAAGLILLRRAADYVDLDADCVLYGSVETVDVDTVFGDWRIPRAAVTNGGVLLVNLLFVIALFKELRISTFDPALATTLGINARLMHYLLMTLVAVTTVAAFESVGSILVIAMLIVPSAAACLLSDRLGVVLMLSCALAVISAVLGHLAACIVPGWFGFVGVSTTSAGMMAVVAGCLFAVAMFAAPRHGILSKIVHRAALALRIAREDVLGFLFRAEEVGDLGVTAGTLHERAKVAGRWVTRVALWSLDRGGFMRRAGASVRLTDSGRQAARQLVRSHRLWETYFGAHAQLPADHLHGPAEYLEHVTDPALQERLADSTGHPQRDPHGTPIPPATQEQR